MGAQGELHSNFDICISSEAGLYRVEVSDHFTPPYRGRFRTQWSSEQYAAVRSVWTRLSEEQGQTSVALTDFIEEFGIRLFRAMFHGEVLRRYRNAQERARANDSVVRIRLSFSGAPELAALPWEYLFDPDLEEPMALSADTTIVRRVGASRHEASLGPIPPPVRVLIASSEPFDWPPLEVQREHALLRSTLADLESSGLVILDELRSATWQALQEKLATSDIHILHFIGHGNFNNEMQRGELILEDDLGAGAPVPARDLAEVLDGSTNLRLVVLSNCEGARGSHMDSYAGIAQTLAQVDIPIIISMQSRITDKAARIFGHAIHSALTMNLPVESAVTQARRSISFSNGIEWGIPAIYMQADDGLLLTSEAATATVSGEEQDTPEFWVQTVADLRKDPINLKERYIQAWSSRWSTEQTATRDDASAPPDSATKIELLHLQKEVFSHPSTFDWPGRNLLITGPTSAGKTFLAEVLMAHVRSREQYSTQQCIYAVPLRALATEKYQAFRSVFGNITAVSSSDHRDDDAKILAGDKRIVVVVYEKLYLWLARARDLLQNTALLIIDELQMVGNAERGAKLEMILTWARDYQVHHHAPQDEHSSDLRIVTLAPSQEAVEKMQPWLDAVPIYSDPRKRPVPLVEAVVTLENTYEIAEDGNLASNIEHGANDAAPGPGERISEVRASLEHIFSATKERHDRYRPDVYDSMLRAKNIRSTSIWDDFVIAATQHFLDQEKKVLVYRASKNSAVRTARLLKDYLASSDGHAPFGEYVLQDLSELEDTHANSDLRDTMPYGVAFHHGDMTPGEREVVERRFRGSNGGQYELSVVVATPTLGMGINLPADVVLMVDRTTFQVTDPNLREIRPKELSVLEYKNFAGRAGRYRWDEPNRYGICLFFGHTEGEQEHLLVPYFVKKPELVVSTLNNPQSGMVPYVLGTIGWLGGRVDIQREDITEVFGRTYAKSLGYPIGSAARKVLNELQQPKKRDRRLPLVTRDTNFLIRGARSAATAAISIKTYDDLLRLQKDLKDYLAAPFRLLVELVRTEQAIRLYPAGLDPDDRREVATATGRLRERYKHFDSSIDVGPRIDAFRKGEAVDDFSLWFYIRAAAVWAWMQGESAKDLEESGAFPRIRWGHLSELGESLGSLVETLGRMWLEVSGEGADPDEQRDMIYGVRLLSLQLRYGVPPHVEELASLRVKYWHRERLVRLWRASEGWEHPSDVRWFTSQQFEGNEHGDLRHHLPALQQRIPYQRHWLRPLQEVWSRQHFIAENLLYWEHRHTIDDSWPELVRRAYMDTSTSLGSIVEGMLRATPLSLEVGHVNTSEDEARGPLLLRLLDDRHVAVHVVRNLDERPVSWAECRAVCESFVPSDIEVLTHVLIAWPGFERGVGHALNVERPPLLLLSLEAFVQACLNVVANPSPNRSQFLALLSSVPGVYRSTDEIDRILRVTQPTPQELADSNLG